MIAAVHQTARISHPLAGRRTRAFGRHRRIAVFLETIASGGKRDRHADRRFISVPQFSMTPSKDSVKPVHVIRLRGITASVFANSAETKNGDVTFHKVSVQRTYKDGNEFKTTLILFSKNVVISGLIDVIESPSASGLLLRASPTK